MVLTGDYEGTIIKIKAKKPGEECAQKVYYRFRMQSEELQYLKCVYTPSNNIFSSSFERNSYIDFRFNDYRTLDAGLIERMQAEKNIPIIVEKFHFLLITKAQVQVTASEQYTERSLNKELWNNYYSEFDPDNLIVANHWHKKTAGEGIKEVALLIKLKENVCTNITIGIYIIVLMMITVLFNVLSNWIWSML